MNLNEYQDKAQGTAVYQNSGSLDSNKSSMWKLSYSVLALCGETGELANKLKKHLRAGTDPDTYVLADELGDVLWYVSAVARELGYTLDQVAAENLEKLRKRNEERKIVG